MKTSNLISYLNDYLQISRYQDRSNNGLQVEGTDEVMRVAFAVDACLASFHAAARERAQLLVAHHGLFWSEHIQLTGAHFERVKTLIDNRVGLYAAHIPLDAHPEVGNNIELARLFGLQNVQPWGTYKGTTIGFIGDLPQPIRVADLYVTLRDQIGEGNLVQVRKSEEVAANAPCNRVAVCSGFGVTFIDEAVAAGADTLVTGEASHSWYRAVEERPINVIYGGHYNTETVGLKALARHIETKFGLSTVFIDLPTEL
jgi:dinuclear metal center YbgI/SA1388 family protein